MENPLLFDLQGNKKRFAYQFLQKDFEAVLRDAIGQEKYKIEVNGARSGKKGVAYLLNGSDLCPLFSVWMKDSNYPKKELIELAIVQIAYEMHADSVKKAIEAGDFQQEYMSGRMSKEDVREITKPFLSYSLY